MARWACVDVPELPLQLLLRAHPEWGDAPACVVAEDRPQGRVLWVNEAARRGMVLPGMRYAAALALCAGLRAGVIGPDEVGRGVAQLAARLRDFSPLVEPCADEPGIFWLEAGGLSRLFPSASAWGRQLREAVSAMGFFARAAVGFTRYGAYAVARSGAGLTVFRDPESESRAARAVPLARLAIDPALRDELDQLGVRTLGEFLELPASDLLERYGVAVHRLHQLAAGTAWAPLRPEIPDDALVERHELEWLDDDRSRLLFFVERLLGPLLERLAGQHELVARLTLRLVLDGGGVRTESVQPAVPTREAPQLLELLALRLEASVRDAPLPAKVEALELEAEAAAAGERQEDLLAEAPRRDPGAARRALARIVAELGPAAVARARLRDGHLPEATFLWEPLAPEAYAAGGGAYAEGGGDAGRHGGPGRHGGRPLRVIAGERGFGADDAAAAAAGACGPAAPTAAWLRVVGGRDPAGPVLVRRLPPRSHHLRDDGWLISSLPHGAVTRLVGPFVISGGWWRRPVHREYHFAETGRGDLLWVYFDRERRRWFLQGHVE
ncbi:MAG: DNA polymerase Y family protein [Acidobacteria bacterium]|nr:DNA polymerase Y family protein [Acidobacteriota bacterium]